MLNIITRACLPIAGVCGLGAAIAAPPLQTPTVPVSSSDDTQATEIVVIGRRSGIPIWRVENGRNVLVLVGTIHGVSKGTSWEPEPLVAALRKADRVMFPQMQQVRASPFAMIGYLAKWRRQSSLPSGQSLAQYLTADQFQRLKQLQAAGVAKKGSEFRHPLHLAMSLRGTARGKKGYGEDAGQYVMRAIQQYKLQLVPVRSTAAKPLTEELFKGSPAQHVPCLLDAMALAEAGETAVVARSEAWAQRRVSDVLESPADHVYHSCFPANRAAAAGEREALHATIRRVLKEPQLTLAVLDLNSLGQEGGVLDMLAASGHAVHGPRWKR